MLIWLCAHHPRPPRRPLPPSEAPGGQEGKTLKELVIRYLEEGLSRKAPSKRPLPQVPEAGRRIRPRIHAELWELLDPPDLNVWFALLVPEHPFHGRARSHGRKQRTPPLCGLRPWPWSASSRIPKPWTGNLWPWAGPGPCTAPSGRPLLEEPEGLEEALVNREFPSPFWTDAYLAALAVAGGHRLVTFDRDFQRFPEISPLLLRSQEVS